MFQQPSCSYHLLSISPPLARGPPSIQRRNRTPPSLPSHHLLDSLEARSAKQIDRTSQLHFSRPPTPPTSLQKAEPCPAARTSPAVAQTSVATSRMIEGADETIRTGVSEVRVLPLLLHARESGMAGPLETQWATSADEMIGIRGRGTTLVVGITPTAGGDRGRGLARLRVVVHGRKRGSAPLRAVIVVPTPMEAANVVVWMKIGTRTDTAAIPRRPVAPLLRRATPPALKLPLDPLPPPTRTPSYPAIAPPPPPPIQPTTTVCPSPRLFSLSSKVPTALAVVN